ncbi:MAG: CAP domain-containing protein [Deltaproteobacteria bacterium]|jgi:uncharacterized protein YkwD|nr:CAP domain-containing protein [Deltaproteobacteria bacterium]
MKYKPFVRIFLFLLPWCFSVLTAAALGAQSWTLPGTRPEATLGVELLKIINQKRGALGLGFLSLSQSLCEVADFEAVILTRNLGPRTVRHPNLNKPIDLSIPLGRQGISGRAVGVLRVFSSFEAEDLIRKMAGNPAENNELFYPGYTSAGIRVSARPNGHRLTVFVLASEKIDLDQSRRRILDLVNQMRLSAGVKPVIWSDYAARAAQIRALELPWKLSHTRPSGRSWASVVTEEKISARSSGENIASGQRDPEKVMEDWLKSPGHRDNILLPRFNRLGVGLTVAPDGRLCWSQLFLEQTEVDLQKTLAENGTPLQVRPPRAGTRKRPHPGRQTAAAGQPRGDRLEN